jgi:hypothetical protein
MHSAADEAVGTASPACPICATSAKVCLYGRQDYAVSAAHIPSLGYRCRACDFNFRRFGRPLAEGLSHFPLAPYSSAENEQRWRKRRSGFYSYLLNLLKPPAQGKSLLDVGCAFGHFLDCAAARGSAVTAPAPTGC